MARTVPEAAEWFTAELRPVAGHVFTRRLPAPTPPTAALAVRHPPAHDLLWDREALELRRRRTTVVVFLPADEATVLALAGLRRDAARGRPLRAVTG